MVLCRCVGYSEMGEKLRNGRRKGTEIPKPGLVTDPLHRQTLHCSTCSPALLQPKSQVAPGLLFTNPAAAVWVLPIPQGNISALSPGETESVCL